MKQKKGLIGEFKEFISRGNVVDLAVGVIIGSAFTAIVTSLVNDMIMPIIGTLFGGIDFTSLKLVIRPAADGVEEAAIRYGNFIQCVVNFLLVSLVIFIVIKTMNRFMRKKEEPAKEETPAEPTEEVLLLREIRDSLKK
ncbi:MAG: large-conductance mechanosensitive channel protein MscL [Clostridia bacterium]|nr:large-conductance mechanosensitive channel protein MscL [Clostridia bacterium]